MKKTIETILLVCDVCEKGGKLIKLRTAIKTRDVHAKCINELVEDAIENRSKINKKEPRRKTKPFVTKDGRRQRNSILLSNHHEYPDLEHSYVKEFLAYDQKKNVLTWIKSPGPTVPVGTVAGNENGSIQIKKLIIKTEQLIKFWLNGNWPGAPEDIFWTTKYKGSELRSFKNSSAGQMDSRM